MVMADSEKKGLAEAMVSMASLGAVFAEKASGQEVDTRDFQELQELEKEEAARRQRGTRLQKGKVLWDDDEEMRYREWLKEQMEGKEDANFSEFQGEEEYRNKLREEAELRGGEKVDWEDMKEKMYREKYTELLRSRQEEVVWDNSGEREAMERAKERDEERRRKGPVEWDLDKWGNPI